LVKSLMKALRPSSKTYDAHTSTDDWRNDRPLHGIVATNLVTLIIAVWQQWGLVQLLWPFWAQSVIIGYYARQRILKLQDFCTEGMGSGGQQWENTPQTLRSIANFFALHYGFFHFAYLAFLLGFTLTADAAGLVPITNESSGQVVMLHVGSVHPLDFVIFALIALGFWRSHRASHLQHVDADLGGKPRLNTLVMMPYIRIVPMHMTIIVGAWLGGGSALWLFVVLKTFADIALHRLEHQWLQQAGATE
jgi:hypothetical protein